MEPIHFFRAGQHTSSDGSTVNFTAADLAAIASSYDPALHEAPIVVGHPKDGAPAFGWVEKIIAKDDGLHAVPRQVNAEFAELVRQGSYKKVSGSFYRPKQPNSPKPDGYYLRHIGFLGAQPPALKGLKPVELSEATGCFDLEEESFFDLREHSLSQRESALRRREMEAEITRLNREGRIQIGEVEGLLSFMDSLSESGVVNFSDGDGKAATMSQREWLLDHLRKRPVMVTTKEICVGDFADPDDEFVTPEGFTADPESKELAGHARQYQRQHNVSFAEAVRAVAARR